MVTFLSGGTGTPKLLAGVEDVFEPPSVTVVANTGEDVELGGLLICPDLDTVLFERAGILDRGTWWGIEDDPTETHAYLGELARRAGVEPEPRYLPSSAQRGGRRLTHWRRFSGAREFMTIGDRDRAVHLLRTGLLDEGATLTEVTRRLAEAFGLEIELLPMTDDPVATIVETAEGPMHFQEYWVHRRGEPAATGVEYRGADAAEPTDAVRAALDGPVVVGPSNPVTSIGPMLAIDGIERALTRRPVVVVSPFVGERAFSGPADALMAATGREPGTAGLADMYGFADGFVLDEADPTELDRPTVRTDTAMDGPEDAGRVARAARDLLEEVA